MDKQQKTKKAAAVKTVSKTEAPKAEAPAKTPAKDGKLERDIESILVEGVRAAHGRAYKWVSPGNDGVPDRIVVLPNRAPVFVELKAAGGKTTPLQDAQIARLREFGQDVRVLRGEAEVRSFLLTLVDQGRVQV